MKLERREGYNRNKQAFKEAGETQKASFGVTKWKFVLLPAWHAISRIARVWGKERDFIWKTKKPRKMVDYFLKEP